MQFFHFSLYFARSFVQALSHSFFNLEGDFRPHYRSPKDEEADFLQSLSVTTRSCSPSSTTTISPAGRSPREIMTRSEISKFTPNNSNGMTRSDYGKFCVFTICLLSRPHIRDIRTTSDPSHPLTFVVAI